MVVDAESPLPSDLSVLSLASHVAFSAQGLTEFAGRQQMSGTNLIDHLCAAGKLLGDVVMVTNGAEGVFWIDRQEILHCPGFPVEVVDTLGAGDVWHGALALGLAEGQPLEQAVVFANAAAAIKCTKFGGRTGIPDRRQVTDFLAAYGPLPKARQLMS